LSEFQLISVKKNGIIQLWKDSYKEGEKGMNILSVAKYILEKQGTMTTMKLQKLCYYSQAWSLVWDEKPLFDEEFEAWANGPVSPELFNYHRGKFVISANDITGNIDELSSEQKETVDTVLKYYGEKEPNWLSELTHKERPWKEAREKANAAVGERCNEVITKESMQSYYGGI
jgi:uncharacterized phage-associated protein